MFGPMDPESFENMIDSKTMEEMLLHNPPDENNPLSEGCTCGMPGNYDYHRMSLLQMSLGGEHPEIFDMPVSNMMDKMRLMQKNMKRAGERGTIVIKEQMHPTVVGILINMSFSYEGLRLIIDGGQENFVKITLPAQDMGVDVYSIMAQIAEVFSGDYRRDTTKVAHSLVRVICESPDLFTAVGIAAADGDDKVLMFPWGQDKHRERVSGASVLEEMIG